MPADTHPAIQQPADPTVSIWRYMDFAKYVALLRDRALYFARLDTLGDPFEGSLSRLEYEYWKKVAQEDEAKGQLPIEWRGRYFDVLLDGARRSRKTSYVSCWHINGGESEAMWRLYSASECAIAIRSTYQHLERSLPSTYEAAEHWGPYLGVVQYADYHVDNLPQGNMFHYIMHKRRSFQHEQECRAVVWRSGPKISLVPVPPEHVYTKYPPGINVPIPLQDLIEVVTVSPSSPGWFAQTVAELTTRYGYSFPVQQSVLAQAPYL